VGIFDRGIILDCHHVYLCVSAHYFKGNVMSFVLGIDEWEYGVVSDCCNAGVYINGICSDCKDHCVPVEEEEETVFESNFGMKFNTREVSNE